MNITHESIRWGFDHEVTAASRIVPPTDDDLVPVLDPDTGEPILDQNGEALKRPKDDWVPTQEEVTLDTIVIVEPSPDGSGGHVFKFATDKPKLAAFVGFYAQFLDAEGRAAIRQVLADTSDIVIPSVAEGTIADIVKGNRAQRRSRG